MPSIPEDELRETLAKMTGLTQLPESVFLESNQLVEFICQYAAKARLDEARHWDEHIIGAPRKVTVNDAARERIKQLKEGM